MYSKIWLSQPHFENEDLNYLKQVFESNWISTVGPNIELFENSIEKLLGNNLKVVALNSGTSAIHVALKLLNISFGDEVICQDFTFCATVNPILYCGAIPVFVDSEKDTWNMCPFYLEEAIKNRLRHNKKPKAIIIVDSYGMPAKWDELRDISKKYEIPIIEDSAEALGSYYKDKMCGAFGDYSIFSFNGNKIITTSSGGALICKKKSDKDKAIFLSTQAKETQNYLHNEVGFNYRMSNVLASIGLNQLKVLNKRIEQRRANNKRYKSFFNEISGINLKEEYSKDLYSNFWLNTIYFDNSRFTNVLILKKMLENNIDVRTLWFPLHKQKYLKQFLFFGEGLSEKLFNNGLCLPSSSNLSNVEFNRIIAVFNSIIKE